MSALALGIDLLASIAVSGVGGFLARKGLFKAGQKLAEKGFTKIATKAIKSSKLQTTADILGSATAFTAYEKLKGDEESFQEKLAENIVLGAIGTTAFSVLRGGAKVLTKVAPDVVKTSLSNAKDKIYSFAFMPGLNETIRNKTASFFSVPNAIMETSEPYVWRVVAEVVNIDDFKAYKKAIENSLLKTAGDEKASIVKKWIELQENRPSSLNVFNTIALEHLLYAFPEHKLSQRYFEIVKNAPFYDEALTSFKTNLAKILKNASLEGDENALKLLDDIDNIAEPLFIRYFPRAHIRLPHETEKRAEDVVQLLLEGELRNPDFIAGIHNYLKRREFPTIFDRLRIYIKLSPVEALENNLPFVDFRKGSDMYKAFLAKFTVPVVLNKLPSFLDEVAKIKHENKVYALLGSKSLDYFTYAKTPISVFNNEGERLVYYLHNNFDNVFRTALDYHIGFVPDITIGGALGAVYSINAFIKKLQLSISPFHAVNLIKNYLATGGEGALKYALGIRELNRYLSSMNYQLINRTLDDFAYIKDTEELARFMKELAQKHPDIPIEFTLASNINAFENYRKHVLEPVLKSITFKEKDIFKEKVVLNLLKLIGKLQAPSEFYTFDVVYKAVKLATAKRVIELYKSGAIGGEEAIRALNHINGIYGGAAVWRYVDPKRQVLIRLLLFAPDWYLSLWRNFSLWMTGDSFLVSSFYPTLARIHLWGVINAHEMAGIDYLERVDQVLTHYIENFNIDDIPKMPLVLLHLMKELYKVPIPVYDKEGKKKIIYFNPPGIEFEPLEMIGLFGLARAVAEGQDILRMPFYQAGEMIKYWSGKLSSILRFIHDITNYYVIGHEAEEAEYAEDVFLKAMESVVPISLIYMFKHGSDIWGDEKALDMVRVSYALKNLSFGVETMKLGKALADAIAIGDTVSVDFILSKYKAYERALGRKDFLQKILETTATHLLKKYGEKDEETLEEVLTRLEGLKLSNDDFWNGYLKGLLAVELRKAVRKHTKKELQKERRRAKIRELGGEDYE